ncbi:magnesium transporter CorA family protein [Belnapia sp. F-4-1]|uniref:magnesium transporter CorA family protein n=1 Tax=Belnapia sp. F-4-1 TaxID=1545443 RepID=UPI0005BE75F1|nr:magnesium transporter CorA family protein [Belnapia sp. F-4-1]
MITAFAVQEGVLGPLASLSPEALPNDVLWVDLHNPTRDEEIAVERLLGVGVPTREEMAEIEESSRLYEDRGAMVMTAVVVTGIAEHRRPSTAEVTFVLTPKTLVTVRYADPLPFRTFAAKCRRDPGAHDRSELVFLSLVENIVNRLADILEGTDAQLDALSERVFESDGAADEKAGASKTGSINHTSGRPARADLQAVVKSLGRTNSLVGKLRESLLSIGRMLAYFRQGMGDRLKDGARARLRTLDRDVASLTEYDTQLSSEIGFLLEATFGLIGIEQNNIIKVFSIAAVLFLPPTLVGTVYGMNFEHMPELHWLFGYPFALVLMVASAVAPYYWFKQRGWL